MAAASSLLSAAVAIIGNHEIMQDVEGLMQLHSELGECVSFLEADNCSLTPKGVEKDVIKLAHEIEDSIESYILAREGYVGKPCGSFKEFFQGRRLKDDVSVFRKRITQIKGGMDSPSADKRFGAAELGTKRSDIIISAGLHKVVGLDEDVKLLSQRLVQGEDKRSVMTIVGMGGIGKTTLARLLFDHPPVKEHFEFRTWAHVGVEFQARGILESILSNACSEWSMEKIEEIESMDLIEQIYKAYKGRRYLVVLDDIWSSEGWETIRFAFPDDKNGSRIIITSRLKDVARRSANFIHEMMPLTIQESWKLMKTRSGRRDIDTMEAEKIGQQILAHCHGIPLFIILFGAQLRFKQFEDWVTLLQHLEREQYGNRSYHNSIVLSYNMLPVYLKPCFLYLGHFPTDHAIPVEKLYLLWIAERFVSTKGDPNTSKFGMAEDYFKELDDRSMVMIQEEELLETRRSKSCRVHDLLRDICLEKAMEEEFFRVVDFGLVKSKQFVLSHRLAIYLNSGDGVSLDIPKPKIVRSLLFFETNVAPTKPNSQWPVEVADLKEFRWARVLDFDGVDLRARQLPRNIKRLVYLRYLSFRDCYLHEFPSSFSKLSFLETLDLWVQESCRITVSNVLWNFKRLMYLYLPVVFQTDHSKGQDRDKLKLNGLAELEILENFHSGLCDVNDLDEELENMRIFTGVVDGNNDDLEKIVKRLKHWKITTSSQYSSLVVKNFDCYSEKRWSIVRDLLTHYTALCVLEIEGHLPRLPSYTEINPNFTEMVFSRSEFEQDPMQILGKLPKLRSLVLSNNAFAGYRMVCTTSDFLQLKILKLAMLQRLRTWEMESGAMPNLARLTIEQCKRLEVLPDELMGITTLQEIKTGSMPQTFQQSVRHMAQKQRVHAKVRVSAY